MNIFNIDLNFQSYRIQEILYRMDTSPNPTVRGFDD
jgi:hypothetical protein